MTPITTGRLEVTSTLGVAFDRAIRMMFKPFDFWRWIGLGFIIFLESLIEGGFGFSGTNFGNPFGGSSPSGSLEPSDIVLKVEEAIRWILDNLDTVLAISIPSVLLLVVLGVVLVWLGCRGQMMFIRAVALDSASLGDNWRATALSASSLFKFRLVLAAINLAFQLGTLAAIVSVLWRLLRAGSTDFGEYLLQLVPIVGVALLVFLALGVVRSLLRSFVAPLMYRFGEDCTDSWRRFATIAKDNVGPIVVFLVMRFCLGIGAAILGGIVAMMTCCIGALPFVHQTLMSPYYVFDRAWSLYALGSLGPEFEIMKLSPHPAAAGDTPGN